MPNKRCSFFHFPAAFVNHGHRHCGPCAAWLPVPRCTRDFIPRAASSACLRLDTNLRHIFGFSTVGRLGEEFPDFSWINVYFHWQSLMLCLIQSWRLPSPEKFPLDFVSIHFVTGPEVTRIAVAGHRHAWEVSLPWHPCRVFAGRRQCWVVTFPGLRYRFRWVRTAGVGHCRP